MESAAALRYFHCFASHVWPELDRPRIVQMHNVSCPKVSKLHTHIRKHSFSPMKWEGVVTSSVKSSEHAAAALSEDNYSKESLDKKFPRRSKFPDDAEVLVHEVCDTTEIAEVKLKVGDFEMHIKRNIGSTKAVVPIVSPMSPPPIPSEPMIESAPASTVPSPPKSSPAKFSPFTNIDVRKSAKLAALEASGTSGYVLVSSPTVGSYRRGRTLKGNKQPPSCKEGDVIKKGQVIGFVDQFGTELPVKSDVAGEVLKLLSGDGEAVGYGDPLVAVLPLFHDIQ